MGAKKMWSRQNGTLTKAVASATLAGLALLVPSGPATADTATNVTFTTIEAGGGPGIVIASGAISGVGTETNNEGQKGPGQPFQDVMTFPQGELFQTVAPAGRPQIQFDPNTCVVRIVEPQSTTVTGGTKAFATATGFGTSTAHITIIENRGSDGTCQQPPAPPRFLLAIVHGTGTVTADGSSHA
jgi:hypothetical protein